MRLFENRFLLALGLFFWAFIIFTLSSVPGTCENCYSYSLLFSRKMAHIIEYFILSILLIKNLSFLFEKKLYLYGFSLFLALVFAASDEFHQTFVAGRSGKISDVVIDLIGILLGLYFFFKLQQKKRA